MQKKLKQKQKIRKYLVFTGMFLLFLGCMWLIFAPSEKDRQEAERKTGFNAELPDPKGTGIEADKMAAYEQADMIRRQEEKKRTLADFSAMADGHRQDNVPETEPAQDIASENESRVYHSGGNGRTGAFASSASAYNDINATLGSFYESPEEDPEKEALKAEVEQLRQAAAAQTAGPSYEEQVALLEKSYELAAKYMLRAAAREQRTVRRRKVPQGRGRRKPFPSGWCPLRSCRPFLSLLPIRYSSQDCFPVRISASIRLWAVPGHRWRGIPYGPVCMATRPLSADKACVSGCWRPCVWEDMCFPAIPC